MRPMIGIMMSLTIESMILPKAAPMMTPMARSTTLPRIANFLNSWSISTLRRLGTSTESHNADSGPLSSRAQRGTFTVSSTAPRYARGDRDDAPLRRSVLGHAKQDEQSRNRDHREGRGK